ncbi:MAG: helix-turn-helix domain-containing protein [Leptospiraceae bacterium]|nr:helix-turn-helix domain-containing protein [Leptospiraceae bacterium]MCP5502422.1 helix-turn-helix domain-containing protein [Leptospiraceae bacterium]
MKKEQYKELFSHLGVTQRGFSREFNIPPSTLSETVNGKIKSLPAEVVYRLHREKGINLDWLMKGEGEMIEWKNTESLTVEEIELFQEVRKDPKLLDTLKDIIKALKEKYK